MADDPTISELIERACRVHRDTVEILAERHRLHVELVRLLERSRDLHYTASILSDKPPPETPREWIIASRPRGSSHDAL